MLVNIFKRQEMGLKPFGHVSDRFSDLLKGTAYLYQLDLGQFEFHTMCGSRPASRASPKGSLRSSELSMVAELVQQQHLACI